MDENFTEHDEWVDGFLARVMQHEFDHLDGTLFIDRLATLRKQMIRSKLTALAKGKVKCNYKIK
jgi:peptide deformylase